MSAWPHAGPVGNGAGEGTCLLPVGTPGGIMSGLDRLRDGGGIVRLGDQLLSLDATTYRMWDAIHVAPAKSALQAWASGLPGTETTGQLLQTLGDRKLIVDWTEDRRGCLALVHSHTVRFLGRCLGNGRRRGPAFLLGDSSSRPCAHVDLLIYEFLLWADGQEPIVDRCGGIDTRSSAVPVDPVQHVVAALPALMRAGLIRLDLCTDRRRVVAGGSEQ